MTNEELAYRLSALELAFGKLEAALPAYTERVEKRLETLQYVPRGEYNIQFQAMEGRIDNAQKLAMTAIGFVIGLIGVIITVALAVN